MGIQATIFDGRWEVQVRWQRELRPPRGAGAAPAQPARQGPLEGPTSGSHGYLNQPEPTVFKAPKQETLCKSMGALQHSGLWLVEVVIHGSEKDSCHYNCAWSAYTVAMNQKLASGRCVELLLSSVHCIRFDCQRWFMSLAARGRYVVISFYVYIYIYIYVSPLMEPF